MRTTSHTFLLFGLLMAASAFILPLWASPVPPLDLNALTSQADLIAVGRVTEVRQEGSTTLQIFGTALVAHRFLARLDPDRVLKGKKESGSLEFTYALPDAPVGYAGIGEGEYAVFFLRDGPRGLEILDPYHPFVVAAPGAGLPNGSLVDRVLGEVAQVFDSPFSTPDYLLRATIVLGTVKGPLATDALKRAARIARGNAQIWAIAALLERGDLSFLPILREIALSPKNDVDDGSMMRLGASLNYVKDPKAIPILAELLGSPNEYVRRGAAAALRNTRDEAAIKPLTQALSDRDSEVRYYAVVGLGEIAGQNEWTPSIDNFNKNEEKFLKHWREWAKENKLTQ